MTIFFSPFWRRKLQSFKLSIVGACSLLALAGLSRSANAQVTLVPNYSFETSTGGDFTPPTDFNTGNDVLVQTQGLAGGPNAEDGTHYVGFGNGTNFTNLFQDYTNIAGEGDPAVTAFTFTAGFALRNFNNESDTTGDTATINLGIQDLTGTGGITILPISRSLLNNQTFTDFSVTLPAATVAAGDSIRLFIDKNAGVGFFVADNLRVTAVPEPVSAGLLGLGALSLLARRRR
jgi:hypothetical protein